MLIISSVQQLPGHARPLRPIRFEEQDPFPRVDMASVSLAQLQAHAEQADAWLGLRISAVESELLVCAERFPEVQTWTGIPASSMLTPYIETRSLLERLAPSPGATLVDLGAGYGRMGFVMRRHFPETRFVGYELISERVREARRCLKTFGCSNAEMIEADLFQITPQSADYYFIYDYGTREAIAKTLEDLREIASSRAICVIGRGRASRDAIERDHPWLSQVIPPFHTPLYSIYRSA